MPVAVKTPAHPAAVHKPRVGMEGEWHVESTEEGVRLLFKDSAGAVHGFVASGKHAQQRVAMAKLLAT
jgi:rubredoxin-NAD+ reductase